MLIQMILSDFMSFRRIFCMTQRNQDFINYENHEKIKAKAYKVLTDFLNLLINQFFYY